MLDRDFLRQKFKGFISFDALASCTLDKLLNYP